MQATVPRFQNTGKTLMPALSNPRHERFAQELAKGKTQQEAYESAGYKMSASAPTRLANDVRICERVSEIQERLAMRTEITVASITEKLLDLAKKAETMASESGVQASRACLMDAAKLNGLVVDKTDNTNRNETALSDAELTAIARSGSAGASEKTGSTPQPDPVH